MPELPEIHTFAADMRRELPGRMFANIQVLQPKCLNVPEDRFCSALSGATIRGVTAHGKWLLIDTSLGWLLLCLGMGGEVLLTTTTDLPEKYRLVFEFATGDCLAVNFWWFGYAHYVRGLAEHKMVSSLGPDFMALTLEDFRCLLHGRRGGIKSLLLNQKRVAGIGNVYVQDPLFSAGIHPLRRIDTLINGEIAALYLAIRKTLQESMRLGGSSWEKNLFGQYGLWDSSNFLVAYREGDPCPACGTVVAKIKTGSTSTHICPHCQPLPATA